MDAKAKFLRKFGGSPHYSDRQLFCLAALTAVCVNLIFWVVLFKYREPSSAVRDSTASVELLSLDSADGGSMRRWISYHDPAKNGGSADPGGFSAQLKALKLFKPPAGRPAHTPNLTAPNMRGFKRMLPSGSDRVPLAGFPRPETVELAERVTPMEVPVASDNLGRSIRIVGGMPPKGAGAVIGDTMLRVTRTGGKTNLTVWMSCGNKILDGHAAGMVSAAVSELVPPPDYVNIRWPSGGAAEVEK